jgi:hypothetical protein
VPLAKHSWEKTGYLQPFTHSRCKSNLLIAVWWLISPSFLCRAGVGVGDPLEWYNEIPVVSRLYLTGSFLTTAACALDLVSPFSLYFNFKLIFYKGQVRFFSFAVHEPWFDFVIISPRCGVS